MKAAMNGQSDTVKSLVAAGADVNTLGNVCAACNVLGQAQ